MKPPTLSVKERGLLREAIERQRPELMSLVDSGLDGRVFSIHEADALRDAISSELAVSGVDADVGAVNERGKRLDALIDHVAAMSDR